MEIDDRNNKIYTNNSDRYIKETTRGSDDFLSTRKDIADEINSYLWVFRLLYALIPNFGARHRFPISEAEYELECSIQLNRLGFYKHAIIALRNVLELGLLSVYFEKDKNALSWLKSLEDTPLKRDVFKKLKRNKNIKDFDEKTNIFKRTDILYKELCNFNHTKGVNHSGQTLSNANVNIFREETFLYWVKMYKEVVKLVTTFHVLKYPIALQYTPMDAKFGLNGPISGFLEPHQTKEIKHIFAKEEADLLQSISDTDAEAVEIARSINERPDLTLDEYEEQLIDANCWQIKMMGFKNWEKNQKNTLKHFKKIGQIAYKEQLKFKRKVKAAAKKRGLL